VTLADLPPDTPARVASISAAGDAMAERRLREVGFDEGVAVELLHAAPFGGDPIAVRVEGATVALRRAHARLVQVEAV
jgi:ferrous iron transport protein A